MSEIDTQLDRVNMESALLVDALRYRWLKNQKNVSFQLSGKIKPIVSTTAHRGSLDSSIDSYMTSEKA